MNGNSSGAMSAILTIVVIAALAGAGVMLSRGNNEEEGGAINIIPANVDIEIKSASGDTVEYNKAGVVELTPGEEYSFKTSFGDAGTFVAPVSGIVAALCFVSEHYDYTEADDTALQIAGGSGACINGTNNDSLVRAQDESNLDNISEEEMEEGGVTEEENE